MDLECPSAERLATVAGGGLDPGVMLHAETCASCRAALVDLLRERTGAGQAAPHLLAPGSVVDRYVIEERLGAGGMGVVYAARDPKLQRTVALKLLRPVGGAVVSPGRLEREAQAAAAVAHPNVVAVYDVGRHGDQVFVAMERILGSTLRTWSMTPRAWREILARLLEVGRGIAAVHAAGFIHRDIKPDNVLIGEDGRARISDFGLARMTASLDASPGDRPAIGEARASSLTQTGAFVGTPAYAAPEQLAGEEVTARADQFAFAVTAWEALYGVRPFDRDPASAPDRTTPPAPSAMTSLATSASSGRDLDHPPRAPRNRGTSRAIERVLHRALARDATARFETMTALVRALETAAGTRRRWLAASGALAIAGLTAGVAFAVRTEPPVPPPPCTGLSADLAGVWDGNAKGELAARFTATGHPAATQRHAAVSRQLDRYATQWASARQALCEATRIRGEASEPQLAAGMHCLDDRLTALRGLVAELARGDAALVDRASDGVRLLPSIERCRGGEPPMANPAAAELRRELAQIPLQLMLRGAGPAKQILDRVLPRAAALAEPALDAELRLVSARVALADGDRTRAAEELRLAIASAERARDDRTRAAAAIAFVDVAVELHALDEATQMAELADAMVVRIGGDRELALGLIAARARLAMARGRPADALPLLDEAFAAAEQAEPGGLLGASLLYDRSTALRALDRPVDADVAWQRATAIVIAHYGDAGEAVWLRLLSDANVALHAGDPRRCAELGERGLAAMVAARGPEDAELGHARIVLYAAYAMLGEWRRARDHMRDAVEVARKTHRKAAEAEALEHLARASLGAGDPRAAVDAYRASAALATELGERDRHLFARFGLGRALVALGADPTSDAAALAVAHREAIDHLEWVLPRLEAMTPRPANLIGMANAALADVLWRRNTTGDRARARGSAATAHAELIRHRDQFPADDPVKQWYRRAIEPEIAAVEAWQAQRAR